MPKSLLFVTLLIVALASELRAETIRLQVDKATAMLDERMQEPIIVIQLSGRSAELLGRFTTLRVNEIICTRLGGRILTVATLREPILRGNLIVTSPETLDAAEEIAGVIAAAGFIDVDGRDKPEPPLPFKTEYAVMPAHWPAYPHTRSSERRWPQTS